MPIDDLELAIPVPAGLIPPPNIEYCGSPALSEALTTGESERKTSRCVGETWSSHLRPTTRDARRDVSVLPSRYSMCICINKSTLTGGLGG
eukprot:scaffold32178_cov59-Phaeocystis_antarctica.AAC.4